MGMREYLGELMRIAGVSEYYIVSHHYLMPSSVRASVVRQRDDHRSCMEWALKFPKKKKCRGNGPRTAPSVYSRLGNGVQEDAIRVGPPAGC